MFEIMVSLLVLKRYFLSQNKFRSSGIVKPLSESPFSSQTGQDLIKIQSPFVWLVAQR
jgi:hypothetical protein